MPTPTDLTQEPSGDDQLREFANGGSNESKAPEFGNRKSKTGLKVSGEDEDLVDDGLEFKNDDPILANTRENDNMR